MIAIDIRSLTTPHPSGVGHYILEILKEISKTKHEPITLFSTGRNTPDLPKTIINDQNITLKHKKIPNKLINLGIALNIVKLKHIIGETPTTVWFPNTGFLPRTTARKVITVHDLAFHLMPETYERHHHIRYKITKALKSIKTADKIIAASESTKQDITNALNCNPKKITTILHGIDHKIFEHKKTPQDQTTLQKYKIKKPYLISIATLEPRKNLQSLIESFEYAKKNNLNYDLLLAGGKGWKRKNLNKKLKTSPNKNCIHLLNFIPDKDRPALLRNATALVLPSRYEGFGMQILEAMACGTPTITSRNSSLTEVTENASLLIRATRTDSLTKAIQELTNSKDLQETIRKKGLKQVKKFSWKKSATETLKLLENK